MKGILGKLGFFAVLLAVVIVVKTISGAVAHTEATNHNQPEAGTLSTSEVGPTSSPVLDESTTREGQGPGGEAASNYAAEQSELLPVSRGDHPSSWSEFVEGKRTTYMSGGNPKAKGLNVSFDYPRSWGGAEGNRSNTLYQVTSEQGKGLELCNLIIKDIPVPAGYTITAQDIDDYFEPKGLKDFVPGDSDFVSGERTTIDGQPAAIINFTSDTSRAGIRLRMESRMYLVYFDGKRIAFGCTVGAGTKEPLEALHKRYETYLPLFQLMANSIIIHDKWKRRP